MRDEAIYLVPYDLTWPRQFEEERTRLAHALRPWLTGAIEHIGSTAIPGLMAKPIIDMMAGVGELVSSLDSCRPGLAGLRVLPLPP